jgi:hypothetical protein
MTKLFSFETMITPKIITYVYWLALLFSVGYGLMIMFGGWGGFTITKFIAGIILTMVSAISARISCELLIIIFKINENLAKIAKNNSVKNNTTK